MTDQAPELLPHKTMTLDEYLAEPRLKGWHGVCFNVDGFGGVGVRYNGAPDNTANDLLEAAQLLEAAELARQDCEECEGDGEPEACGTCFPSFDDARVKRRLAILKATGMATKE